MGLRSGELSDRRIGLPFFPSFMRFQLWGMFTFPIILSLCLWASHASPEELGASASRSDGPTRVLFDHTKGEGSGNADWVVDDDEPEPSPVEPRAEGDWLGAYSSWGFELKRSGRYVVMTLPMEGGRITFGDDNNPLDLSMFHVFVLPEPNLPLPDDEIEAILGFVRHGGGLFLIGNHCGADRDGDGYDPSTVLNALEDHTGVHFSEKRDGERSCWFSEKTANVAEKEADPIILGPHGEVRAIELRGSTSLALMPSINPTVRGQVWRRGRDRDRDRVIVASATLGKGRIVALGDSSPADDGTGRPGKKLHRNWQDGDHLALFLNATEWLAGE